jgi:hypothetical protein
MSDILALTANTPASLATQGHVFCAGTLAQCLFRWQKLPEDKKSKAFLKMGRDGIAPTILGAPQIEDLAARADLVQLLRF